MGAVALWCASRQEDSEKLKSSVPPVIYTAGGIFMPPDSKDRSPFKVHLTVQARGIATP